MKKKIKHKPLKVWADDKDDLASMAKLLGKKQIELFHELVKEKKEKLKNG